MVPEPTTLKAEDRAAATVESSLESWPGAEVDVVTTQSALELSPSPATDPSREDNAQVVSSLAASVTFRTGPMPTNPLLAQVVQEHAQTIQFLEALFEPDDLISIRLIESYTDEGGKKQSHTYFRDGWLFRIADFSTVPDPLVLFALRIQLLQRKAATFRANVYVGVNRREGQKHEKKFQIRRHRAIPVDLDGVAVEEALSRVRKAELPEPALVTASGTGVHLYFFLNEPYDILDGGPSLAVEQEFHDQGPGEKKARLEYYIDPDNQERRYLPANTPSLSPMALRIERVTANAAKCLGGDSIQNADRVMGLPGTLNRKNERNGQEPKRRELVKCDPPVCYTFEHLEEAFRQAAKRVGTGQPRKSPSVKRTKSKQPSCGSTLGRWNTCLRAYVEAPVGERSEKAYGLLCEAHRQGMNAAEVYEQVKGVGKFAERDEKWFLDRWEKAKEAVEQDQACHADQQENEAPLRPLVPTLAIREDEPLYATLERLQSRLMRTGDCFLFGSQLCVVQGGIPRVISRPEQLAGLLVGRVEVAIVRGSGESESLSYKPLPREYATTFLNSSLLSGFLAIRAFGSVPMYDSEWILSASGYNAASGLFYHGPLITPATGRPKLDELLEGFCFREPADRANYIGLLVDGLIRGFFPGGRPMGLLSANQRGLGKTELAQIVAALRDGGPARTASYLLNDEELEKRIASLVLAGATTIILDNAKADRRNCCISSAVLERSISDPILSFRRLGANSDIAMPNAHLFLITANSAHLSPDLIARSLPVSLYYEGDPRSRRYKLERPAEFALQYRLELLGELVGMIELWKNKGRPLAELDGRFQPWLKTVGGILAVNDIEGFMSNAVEAAHELDPDRLELEELAGYMLGEPPRPAGSLAAICQKHGLLKETLGDRSERSRGMQLGLLLGRYLNEQFTVPSRCGHGEAVVMLVARDDRHKKQKLYAVELIREEFAM